MKVVWSFIAAGNLIESNRYIAKENPEAARVVIKDIHEAENRIKDFPEKGRVVPEIRKNNIKEIFCRGYRIIYKIETKKIIILTVRHMKQQLNKEVIK